MQCVFIVNAQLFELLFFRHFYSSTSPDFYRHVKPEKRTHSPRHPIQNFPVSMPMNELLFS